MGKDTSQDDELELVLVDDCVVLDRLSEARIKIQFHEFAAWTPFLGEEGRTPSSVWPPTESASRLREEVLQWIDCAISAWHMAGKDPESALAKCLLELVDSKADAYFNAVQIREKQLDRKKRKTRKSPKSDLVHAYLEENPEAIDDKPDVVAVAIAEQQRFERNAAGEFVYRDSQRVQRGDFDPRKMPSVGLVRKIQSKLLVY